LFAEGPSKLKISDEDVDKIAGGDRVDLDRLADHIDGLKIYRLMVLLRHLEFEMRWARLWRRLFMTPSPAVAELQSEFRRCFGILPDQKIVNPPKLPILWVADRSRLKEWIGEGSGHPMAPVSAEMPFDTELEIIIVENRIDLEQLAQHFSGAEIKALILELRRFEHLRRSERRWLRMTIPLLLGTEHIQSDFSDKYGFLPEGTVTDPPTMLNFWITDGQRFRKWINQSVEKSKVL
jgi:hypothetical protein